MVITNRSLSEAPVKAPEQEVWLEFKSQDPKVRNIFKLDAVACTVIENTRSFPTFHLSKNVNLLKEENTMHRYLLHSAGNQSQGLLHARYSQSPSTTSPTDTTENKSDDSLSVKELIFSQMRKTTCL
ncbi:uncharacterized protein RHO17_005864 isoform 3-T3 [Thomomys bottae]